MKNLSGSRFLVFLTLLSSLEGYAINNDCSVLKNARPSSVTQWPMPNGVTLSVCAYGNSDVQENEVTGLVTLFWKENKKIVRALPELNSQKKRTPFIFSIEKIGPSQVTITRIFNAGQLEIGGENTPVMESIIDCSKKTCLVGPETCIQQQQKIYPKSVNDLELIASEKKGIKEFPQYDTMLSEVVSSALAGDKRALNLVLDKFDRLGADGAVAGILAPNRELIRELVNLGCIKR